MDMQMDTQTNGETERWGGERQRNRDGQRQRQEKHREGESGEVERETGPEGWRDGDMETQEHRLLKRDRDGQEEKQKQDGGMKKQMQREAVIKTDRGTKDSANGTPHSLNFLLAFLGPSVILASCVKPLAGRRVAAEGSGHQH